MAKENEIDYVRQVAMVEDVPVDQFREYLKNKPFSDPRCGEYLMDIAQVMSLLPQPPAKLLDVGVGSGWTSELFASRGYQVLGLDISPDMIDLARSRSGRAEYLVCDYESGPIPGQFDVAVIYDALHHAENELAVLANIHKALLPGGVLVTVEPGAGHSKTADSIEVMRKYGTTEKDMPYSYQAELARSVGFGAVSQHIRLSQIPVEDVATLEGSLNYVRHGVSLAYGSATGLTSVMVAKKVSQAAGPVAQSVIADKVLALAVAHDKFLQKR